MILSGATVFFWIAVVNLFGGQYPNNPSIEWVIPLLGAFILIALNSINENIKKGLK